ncbi:hypothetical protein MMC31_000906 [Peltigera leucophlebia]|nr:hypothetical protein [Peltigera leucophlebia]
MEAQYSHGSPYAPVQPLETQRPLTAVQGARTSSQTLPPFSSYNHLLSLTYQHEPDHQAPQVAGLQISTSLVDPYTAFSNNTQNAVPSYSSQPTYTQFQRPFMLPQPYSLQNPNTEAFQPYRSFGNNQGRLPAICPIPDYLKAVSSPPSTHWSSLSSPFQLHITPNRSHPIHVVGFQGRRGNIPCENRIAPAIDHNLGGQSCAHVPIKDENGKYPCSYCAKTYLHAKHLKRHMLRHTGIRPYSCGLCKDTFSRSDILKRHFSKCSVRRGNPTGEHHLSHSRATKKSRLEAAAKARAFEDSKALCSNQPEGATGNELSPSGSFDLSALRIGASRYSDESQPISSRASRSNSVKRPSGSQTNCRDSSASSYDPIGYVYSGGRITPDSVTTSGAVTPFQYLQENRPGQFTNTDMPFIESIQVPGLEVTSRPPTVSGYASGSLPQILESGNGRGTDIDWPPLFHSDTHENYGNAQFGSNMSSAHQLIKSEADLGQSHRPLEPKTDFRNLPLPLPNGYASYMPTKF